MAGSENGVYAMTLPMKGSNWPSLGAVHSDYQYTPLHLAAVMGHVTAIHALLKHHAQVDALDSRYGTPFLRAVFCGQLEAAKMLEAAGADVYATLKDGHNALDEAISYGYVFESYIERGDDNLEPSFFLKRAEYLDYMQRNPDFKLIDWLRFSFFEELGLSGLHDLEQCLSENDEKIQNLSERPLFRIYQDIPTLESNYHLPVDFNKIFGVSIMWHYHQCHTDLIHWLIEKFDFNLNRVFTFSPENMITENGKDLICYANPLWSALNEVKWHEQRNEAEDGAFAWKKMCVYLVEHGAALKMDLQNNTIIDLFEKIKIEKTFKEELIAAENRFLANSPLLTTGVAELCFSPKKPKIPAAPLPEIKVDELEGLTAIARNELAEEQQRLR